MASSPIEVPETYASDKRVPDFQQDGMILPYTKFDMSGSYSGLKGKVRSIELSIADENRQIRELKDEVKQEFTQKFQAITNCRVDLEEFKIYVKQEFECLITANEQAVNEYRKEVSALKQQVGALFKDKVSLQEQIASLHRHLNHLDDEIGKP